MSGLGGAAIIFWFLWKLNKHEQPLDPADYDMIGVLGKVASPIRAEGTGELIYSRAGSRRCAAARSEDGSEMPRDTEVVVTRFEKGIVYVRRWDELNGEKLLERYICTFRKTYVVIAVLVVVAAVFPDVDVRAVVSKGRSASGAGGLRNPRHAHHQRTRHGYFSDARNVPRAVAATDVVRRGSAAGAVHAAGRRSHGGSGCADQGEVRSGIDHHRRRTISHQERRRAARA